MGASSYVIEEAPISGELEREFLDLNTYYGSEGSFFAYKVSFLKEEELIKNKGAICLASAIVVYYLNSGAENLRKRLAYVYEAFVAFPKAAGSTENLLNNFYHTGRTFDVTALEKQFKIAGTYFCQQNGYTSVCAHSALKMIMNSNSSYISSLVTTSQINDVLGIDHVSKKADTGLRIKEELDPVLNHFGLSSILGNFFERPEMNVCQYLYSVIESGNPALVKYATRNDFHALPVIGHTLNTDEWFPEANLGYIGPGDSNQNSEDCFRYHPSSTWVDHFLIHDDNFGMYLCLTTGALKKITLPSYDPYMRPHSVIGVYSRVNPKASPGVIEPAGAIVLKSVICDSYKDSILDWGKKLYQVCSTSSSEHLVLRTLLIKRTDYEKHLVSLSDHKRNKISNAILENLNLLPEYFWMTEFTLPNLYTANKTKLGEALFHTDYIEKNDEEEQGEEKEDKRLNSMLAAFRGPGKFLLRSDTKSEFVPIPDTIISHVDLFRSKSSFTCSEW
jgi:hypothetical protein